jgi:hypothetical protein
MSFSKRFECLLLQAVREKQPECKASRGSDINGFQARPGICV